MIKCSRCKKRLAMIFVTKMEGGEKKTEGLCMHCARELGLPIEDMMGDHLKKMGLTPEQMEELEDNVTEYSDNIDGLVSDDEAPVLGDDGGATSIDMQKLFSSAFGALEDKKESEDKKEKGKEKKNGKKEKDGKTGREFLDKYCKNLTEIARRGGLDRIVGRKNELARVIQILCRRQKNNRCRKLFKPASMCIGIL